ncbi:MAG: preprotein translocase subunit YajC [bacterium]|jgi:preprotein translocase subunit YajC
MSSQSKRILALLMISFFLMVGSLYAQQRPSTLRNKTMKPKKQKVMVDTLYLTNGEIVKGKIKEISPDLIVIQSALNYGEISIPRSSISIIEFPSAERKMAKMFGIGYRQYKSTLNNSEDSFNYTTDELSLKTFYSDKFFLELLFGYGKVTVVQSSVEKSVEVSSSRMRLGMVYKKTSNMLHYIGVSAGIIQVKDDINSIDASGTMFSGFAGVEFFFPSLPNFGFSGEISISQIDAGDYKRQELGVSTFPSFSIHYYF